MGTPNSAGPHPGSTSCLGPANPSETAARPGDGATPAFRLIARLLCRADGPAEADRLQARLIEALRPWAAKAQSQPEPYWKETCSFEISLLLHPADPASFDRILVLAERRWWLSRDIECSAVWNPEPGHVLLDPAVFWAEVILGHASAPESVPDRHSGA